MWGALISAAAGAVGMAMNAIQNKKAREAQQAEASRQAAYYENKANENPLMRADNQALLHEYDRKANEQVQKAQNVAAIMGTTPEYALAQQKQLADGRVDLMGKIAANNEQQKAKLLESAEQARQQRAKDAITSEQDLAKGWGTLISNVGNAFNSMDFSGAKGKKTTSKTQEEQ